VRAFGYRGPSINSAAPVVQPGPAIDQLFSWFSAAGGTAMRPILSLDAPSAADTASPPRTDELSFGVSRLLGQQGHVRLDVTRRTFADENRPDLERTQTGFSFTNEYRFGHYADVDAHYEILQPLREHRRVDERRPAASACGTLVPGVLRFVVAPTCRAAA
jgi:hypothetical protein